MAGKLTSLSAPRLKPRHDLNSLLQSYTQVKHRPWPPTERSAHARPIRGGSALRSRADLNSRMLNVRSSLPAQPVDATQALNLSAGVSNCKVSRGRSLS